MGFKLQDDEEIISDINVTPFVDVMLVLLVIFMISAPLLFNGLDLTLPKTKKVTALQLKNNQIILSISETGALYLNDKKILYQELINLIKERMEIEKSANCLHSG
jgi:biopolymer transport protein TolR